MKPALVYTETDYNHLIPIDIPPSVLESLLGKKVLVVCSREGMCTRLNACLSENPLYQGQAFEIQGVWDLKIDKVRKLVQTYQVVVVVGRSRVSDYFTAEIEALERACS